MIRGITGTILKEILLGISANFEKNLICLFIVKYLQENQKKTHLARFGLLADLITSTFALAISFSVIVRSIQNLSGKILFMVVQD